MPVHPFTRDTLPSLEALLRASYGDGLELADELEYFPQPPPRDWLFVTDATGEPQGFIRYYPVDEHLLAAEFFVAPGLERARFAHELLAAFGQRHALPANAMLRVDLAARDTELQRALEAHARVVEDRTFWHFARTPLATTMQPARAPLSPQHLEQTKHVLGTLIQYDENTLQRHWLERNLFVVADGAEVVAAAHLQSRGAGVMDIASIATARHKRGQGFGTRLLEHVLNAQDQSIRTVELKVHSSNTAATKLYERCGFQRVPDNDQVWRYTVWNAALS
jgi:ribosomal protein S18 acetylase RimI-like enzyme